jgi:hypothetical protein
MKSLQIFSLLLVLAVASSAVAQAEDWQALQGIAAGTKIKLILKHKRTFGHCQLEAVSDDELICYSTALGSRRYARGEIREVRLGRHSARNGFFIGAAAGAVAGAANGSGGARGRVFYLIILTPVLGGLGAGIGAAVDPFVDGKTVYRSADVSMNHPPKPQPSTRNESDGAQTPVQR